jgi:hypothetical protein
MRPGRSWVPSDMWVSDQEVISAGQGLTAKSVMAPVSLPHLVRMAL